MNSVWGVLKIPKTGLNFKQKGHQRGDGKQNQNLPNHGAASYPKEVWGQASEIRYFLFLMEPSQI